MVSQPRERRLGFPCFPDASGINNKSFATTGNKQTSPLLQLAWFHKSVLIITHLFIRLASLGGGPQAHVHMEGKKCSTRTF